MTFDLKEDQQMVSDGEDDMPVLKRLEADLSGSADDLASPGGKQVDLFSEIHLNELKKLEKQLELVETEKVNYILLCVRINIIFKMIVFFRFL